MIRIKQTVSDPDYVVQGCYSDGRVCETSGSDNEREAVMMALDMLEDWIFTGDYVVVLHRDGECIYDSRETSN